jgi:hypothetical protein
MSNDEGVRSFQEARDASSMTVTPAWSKGALGTWRSQCGPRTLRRGKATLEAGTSLWVNQRGRGVCVSALESRRGRGKPQRGKPRSEPDWGNPTVRDRRGACGNVAGLGSRTEAHRETDGIATVPFARVRAALLSRPTWRLPPRTAVGFGLEVSVPARRSQSSAHPQSGHSTLPKRPSGAHR